MRAHRGINYCVMIISLSIEQKKHRPEAGEAFPLLCDGRCRRRSVVSCITHKVNSWV